MTIATDVIVIGAGLAGLVAASEIAALGKRVILVDQEGEQSLGGQAFWSLGGLFLVNTPEQRRLRVRDSADLALQDWFGTAGFDRADDHWPRLWAQAYVAFAAGEMRPWLRQRHVSFFPIVGWAERGGYNAIGHGNSVPRFHIVVGAGPALVQRFEQRARGAAENGQVIFKFRHRIDAINVTNGTVDGVYGTVLEPTHGPRGVASSRQAVGDFAFRAQAVIVASGGIGGDLDLVRRCWPTRLGHCPAQMIVGVPAHVDGRMLAVAQAAGARLINRDRMWHYVEGLQNWRPIWPHHGIRILAGPSSMWFDALGKRLPPPLFPGFDTLGTLIHILKTGYDYSWFVLTRTILRKEFALSGSEQNPDLTRRNVWRLFGRVFGRREPQPVEAFKKHGVDFVVKDDLRALVDGMNSLTDARLIDFAALHEEIAARDRQIANRFSKDAQIIAIRNARQYLGDRLVRAAPPHRILDPAHGPLIAVRLHILTRKTLGGLETDLDGRVLGLGQQAVPGLFAAGEASGFGGGGMHGYRSLEGTFLGGCIFSGRAAGRAAGEAIV
jgi:predicted oxidoreductase